jgi:hypothetical protein
MPGGAPSLHVSENVEEEQLRDDNKEEFRELFVSQEAATPVRTPESLESMPVKELRRLAEQRGIAGAADMRKKEILAALRKQVTPAGEVAVQKTLDLTVEADADAHVEENADAEAEITLETYDKHHVKVPKSIATRSAIINMMIEGARLCVSLCIAPRGAAAFVERV